MLSPELLGFAFKMSQKLSLGKALFGSGAIVALGWGIMKGEYECRKPEIFLLIDVMVVPQRRRRLSSSSMMLVNVYIQAVTVLF